MNAFNAFGNSWDIEPHEGEASTGNSQLHKIFNSPRYDEQMNLRDNALIIEKADDPELEESAKYKTYDQHPGYRRKRALTQHVVEMAFIIEYEEYCNWTSLYGNIEGMSQLRLWYSFIAEGINAVYQGIKDSDISISTSVTVLKVLTTPDENQFLNNVTETNGTISTKNGVNALTNWVKLQVKNSQIPKSDHYMLFTRPSLLGISVIGTANTGATCTDRGVSIITNTRRHRILGVAPHELAHSLGAKHDNDTNGSCSDSDKNVMAASLIYTPPSDHPASPWTFSNCSINYFKTYLSKVNCTRPENTIAKNEFPTPVAGQRAGETFSKDQQCQIYLNNMQSKYCPISTGVNAALCTAMRCCKINGDNTCSTTCKSFRPLDYTNCDVNKACYRTFCIAI
ncbi:hypothetical protein Btru_062764 [Bulinus truncatus]|nr:hypothetical protein Btru_062764 [Bulinus truncatus]